MKKIITGILLFILGTLLFAETRTLYFTRHGQRGDPKYQKKFKFCDEDSLMPDGKKQATLLGAYLKEKGFKGTIYVSPYYRTLQTASLAAEAFPDLPIILEPRLQETVSVKDNTGIVRKNKKCMTKKEIKKNFPKVKIPGKVKFPWRYENERQAQMDNRIGLLIDEILTHSSGDAFLVAHAGMMAGVFREMEKRCKNVMK